MSDLNWSDAQWQKVKESVNEAYKKASIRDAFLRPPLGPLLGSAETVRNELIVDPDTSPPNAFPYTITLDADHDHVNVKLVTVTVNVALSSEQVAEEALSNATLAFRRAANILAQEEDRVVFNGFGVGGPDSVFVSPHTGPHHGLADVNAQAKFGTLKPPIPEAIVEAVVHAVNDLENRFNPGPFACVLGNDLFEKANAPTAALVLPSDRIRPLLKGGPFLCSGTMNRKCGIVVSLAGNVVDVVMGTPPTVQFLHRSNVAKFIFRVYERFVLRIRDLKNSPVAGFKI
jgi:uncharacterized linocin/CFP29 family protein